MKILKYLIALMLFATPFLQGQHFLSIAEIFQDEACFLDEWIDHHKMLGAGISYNYQDFLNSEIESVEISISECVDGIESGLDVERYYYLMGLKVAYQEALIQYTKFIE